jgi:hypothetical protein
VYAVLSHNGFSSTEDAILRASLLNRAACFMHVQGKFEEAEVMGKRALAGYEKALEPDHPDTLRVVQNLGSLYHGQISLAPIFLWPLTTFLRPLLSLEPLHFSGLYISLAPTFLWPLLFSSHYPLSGPYHLRD